LPLFHRPVSPARTIPGRKGVLTGQGDAQDGSIGSIIATTATMIGKDDAKTTICIELKALRIIVVARRRPCFALRARRVPGPLLEKRFPCPDPRSTKPFSFPNGGSRARAGGGPPGLPPPPDTTGR
jgi:hypothetical protein